MHNETQKEWCNGKYIPPKKKKYKTNEEYLKEIDIPYNIKNAYIEGKGN